MESTGGFKRHAEFLLRPTNTYINKTGNGRCSAVIVTKNVKNLVLRIYLSFQITTNKMQLFLIYLFLQMLYTFQAVPPPIIRST